MAGRATRARSAGERPPHDRATPLAAAGLLALLASGGCAGLDGGRPAGSVAGSRTALVAGLLEMEDRRAYDPVAVVQAVASRDPWVRSRAALACGRLRVAEASARLPGLLADPDPSVRRAAAFASGISGDVRLVEPLLAAISDADRATASEAATALGLLGGPKAEEALRAIVTRRGGPLAAAAAALHRVRDPGLVPLLVGALGAGDADARRSAAWALARSPRPGSEPSLRGLLSDPDPEIAAWAARGLGLLGDAASVPALLELARGPAAGPAIQALLALERLAANGLEGPAAREAGLARHRDGHPGVALAALTLLRRAAGEPSVDEALAAVARAGGRRGGVALASLAAGAPDAAFALAFPPGGGAPLELRLGAAEALPLLPRGRAPAWLAALLSDPSPRVRMEAVSRFPREVVGPPAAGDAPALLVRVLADPDGGVRAAALDAAAPLASGAGAVAAVRDAWRVAFASALASGEADFVATALSAAASLAEGGRELLSARRDDPDDLVRDGARRLLAERFGEEPSRDARRPVATRLSGPDYRRLARLAETGLFLATVTTPRGAFEVELRPDEAPMTVDSFVSLARKGFFDGTTIHRIVPDFVVQGGDPRGDGTGGPGYALRDERGPLPYVRGRLGMALSGPDTGGSQWFVTLSRQPHLDGAYPAFGEVVSGIEVLDRIEQDDRLVSVTVREGSRPAPPGFLPAGR